MRTESLPFKYNLIFLRWSNIRIIIQSPFLPGIRQFATLTKQDYKVNYYSLVGVNHNKLEGRSGGE